jgi:hypothetical protein
MRQSARAEFLAKYDAERNQRMMLEIYQQAITRRHGLRETAMVAIT